MTQSDCFVSVVAPLDRDADIVEAFVEEVSLVLKRAYENYELVLVDDGSDDETVPKVSGLLSRHPCIRLVRLSRAFGRETAISAGLDSAIGDFVVVMIPEDDPPDLIPQMVERCRKGVGAVFGIRAHRRGDPLWLRVGASLFYFYFNRILRGNVPRNSSDFRVFGRQAVNAITRIKDRLRYLRTFSAHVGYGTDSFVYEPRPRRGGRRRRSFRTSVRTAVDMIVANSPQPLQMVGTLGLLMALLTALHVAGAGLMHLLRADGTPGWASGSVQVSALFCFVFLILSTLCAYVDQLLGEVRDRPQYYVLEERNSSVMLADETRKNVVTQSSAD